jgi:hypothetical protein
VYGKLNKILMDYNFYCIQKDYMKYCCIEKNQKSKCKSTLDICKSGKYILSSHSFNCQIGFKYIKNSKKKQIKSKMQNNKILSNLNY